jgi:pimeloyl-ACP methyl ester carboxylesterase
MENRIKIEWQKLFQDIPGLKTDVTANVVEIAREAIPIIFVPGIMGSRLMNVTSGAMAWDPDDSPFMAKSFLLAGPYGKKMTLIGPAGFNPRFLIVPNHTKAHNDKYLKPHAGAVDRHWGGVMWGSYATILTALQNEPWPDPVCHCFELPVHAFGYNWTDSTASAGKRLATYINEVIARYKSKSCQKVILVTHSMGGIVSRWAMKREGMEAKVLGVVHGAQPVNGSPAAYWRMKAGFEPSSGYLMRHVLGANGAQVTALLGNMPGGLQLLPNKNYRTHAGAHGWLYVKVNGQEKHLPQANPYQEIYRKKDTWWRLIDPELLEPKLPDRVQGGKVPTTIRGIEERSAAAAWQDYLGILAGVEKFHDELGLGAHANTYSFHGSGIPTEEPIRFSYEKQNIATAVWHGISNAYANSGGFRTYFEGEAITLKDGDGDGDGTVALSSGSALAHGPQARRWQVISGAGHQPFYQHPLVVMYTRAAVANLCRAKILKEIYREDPDR